MTTQWAATIRHCYTDKNSGIQGYTYSVLTMKKRGIGGLGEKLNEISPAVKNMQNDLKSKAEKIPGPPFTPPWGRLPASNIVSHLQELDCLNYIYQNTWTCKTCISLLSANFSFGSFFELCSLHFWRKDECPSNEVELYFYLLILIFYIHVNNALVDRIITWRMLSLWLKWWSIQIVWSTWSADNMKQGIYK